MKTLHLVSTSFEWDLAGMEASLKAKEVARKLSRLPILYMPESDGFIEEGKQWPEGPFDCLEFWGHSKLTEQVAKHYKLPYKPITKDLVQHVNSKAFSHSLCPLPGSRLIANHTELGSFSGTVVAKTLFGASGNGNFVLREPYALPRRLQGQKLLIEPWKQRVLDFSTQWRIELSGEIRFLGACTLQNSPLGAFETVATGYPDTLKPQEAAQHEDSARKALAVMQSLGYWGPCGFDAMIYEEAGIRLLQPIVEINARQTMGLVALKIQAAKKLPTPYQVSLAELLSLC